MWIASWIFFYGAYHVILYRNPKYFLVTLGACLMHWSFISVNALLFIYYLIGNRNYIYLPIVIVSFILPNLAIPFLGSISSHLGTAIETRYELYTSESYITSIQDVSQQASWFISLNNNLIFYYLLFSIIIIRLINRELMNGKAEENWYSFMLLFLSFVNFGRHLPAFGYRMQILFLLFATVYVFFYFMKLPGRKIKILTIIGLFPMVLYTAIKFRIGSETISPWFFTPGFGLPWLDPSLTIADLIFH